MMRPLHGRSGLGVMVHINGEDTMGVMRRDVLNIVMTIR